MLVSGRMAKIGMSFNRYMVECELCDYVEALKVELVLIDTWWNVNMMVIPIWMQTEESFNRYMVECE